MLALKNVSYTNAEDWREWHKKISKTLFKFPDLRNKNCVDNKHLPKEQRGKEYLVVWYVVFNKSNVGAYLSPSFWSSPLPHRPLNKNH